MLSAFRKVGGLVERFFGLSFFYGVVLLCFGYWLFQWQKFRGVENWPKVEARIITHDSYSIPYRLETRTGSRSGATSGGYVTFEYLVNGRTYQSSFGSPNGGGLPAPAIRIEGFRAIPDNSWHAYYKPGEPGLAVLSPEPYKGTVWLAIGTTCAFPVILHLFFLLTGKIRKVWAGEMPGTL